MIRSIPNPPMAANDIKKFRDNLKKHFQESHNRRGSQPNNVLNEKERHLMNVITLNSGGKNPILN